MRALARMVQMTELPLLPNLLGPPPGPRQNTAKSLAIPEPWILLLKLNTVS